MKVTLEPFKGKRIFNCLHCHTVLKEGEEEVCGECEEEPELSFGHHLVFRDLCKKIHDRYTKEKPRPLMPHERAYRDHGDFEIK